MENAEGVRTASAGGSPQERLTRTSSPDASARRKALTAHGAARGVKAPCRVSNFLSAGPYRLRRVADREIVVGVSGGSGALLAQRFVEIVLAAKGLARLHLVISDAALRGRPRRNRGRHRVRRSLGRPPRPSRALARARSRSTPTPTSARRSPPAPTPSAGMASSRAARARSARSPTASSRDLLQRAADVCLKERRPLAARLPRVAVLAHPHREHAPRDAGGRDRRPAPAGVLHRRALGRPLPGRVLRARGAHARSRAARRAVPVERRRAGPAPRLPRSRADVPGERPRRASSGSLRTTLEMIKFSHTLFALPFALYAAFLAAGGWPAPATLGKILLAMVGARSAAMAHNRLADRRIDAANPRTASRALPSGALSVGFVRVFLVASVVLFVAAAASLNRLTLLLSPVALALLLLLLVHEALHRPLAPRPRPLPRARARRRLDRRARLARVAADPPRPRGPLLDGRVRRHLCAPGRGLRPRARACSRSRPASARARALVVSALLARRDGRAARRGLAPVGRRRDLPRRHRRHASRRSSTSTRSSGPATCRASTRRSSPRTASSPSRSACAASRRCCRDDRRNPGPRDKERHDEAARPDGSPARPSRRGRCARRRSNPGRRRAPARSRAR